jgi:hypothetical protein
MRTVRLIDLAHGKSGDKGNVANVGVIALDPRSYPALLREVTPERVRAHFGDWVRGDVERYELPGLNALNFVLRGALGGGSTNSLRVDVFGHNLAPLLMRMEVEVHPDELPREDNR